MTKLHNITKMQTIVSCGNLPDGTYDDRFDVTIWQGETVTDYRNCSVEFYGLAMDHGFQAKYHDTEYIDESGDGGASIAIDSFEF